MMILDTYVDYLRQLEPRTESRAVRALLTLGGPRTKKLQVMLNVDGIRFCTRTYVTTDSDQMGQIHLRQEELKLRRIGHDAMMQQDAVYIRYEADVTLRSHRASGHRSGSERDADENLGKNGLHEGRPKSDESPTDCSQSESDLRSRKNTNNGPPRGRT